MRTAIAFVLIAAPAADLPPEYDVARWCGIVAKAGGSYSAMIDNGCRQQEQDAYDTLKPIWSSVPDAARKWCDQVATAGGSGSYVILAGCVEQELDARKEMPTFKR